jgi:S-(hydroxymethyl)glutathione dehydrogenase/alcohol dehydrogenase
MKMTAAVLVQCGQPLQLLELEVPKLQRGQVLVKIAYSAICRSQLMEINGLRGRDKWLPHLLGHEASGEVEAVGPDVTKVRPGDEVILSWIKSRGIESSTPQYLYQGQLINAGPITTFSNFSIVSENRVVKKPADLALDVAVLFGCALVTGSGMAFKELHIKKDESVLVLGLGGVGISALLALKAMGLQNIFAADKDESKCNFAASFGVRTVSLGDHLSQAPMQFDGVTDGFDYCIEAGGSVESIELGFSLIKPKSGTLLFASHPPSGEKIKLDPHELICGKSIKGSWGGSVIPDEDFPKLSRLFLESGLSLASLVEQKFLLSDINAALSLYSSGELFRPILAMQH